MSELADFPLLTAEFLAVDTETNGLARDACELTEVGAVLVGGGELHERWSSLVGVAQPLSRGIQRFTGHLAGDGRRRAAAGARAARARRSRCAGACSSRTTRASTRACCARRSIARRSSGPIRPSLCTVALARRLAPLQRRRGLAALADALGIEVDAVHRALPDAETCARVFCALFSEAVRARGRRSARRSRCCGPRRGGEAAQARGRAAPAPPAARHVGRCRRTPASTSSATPTAARCTSASRSACGRGRARTSRRRGSGPARPSTSTTSPRTPSSARSCSRTGSSRRSSRRATSGSRRRPTATSTCAAGSTSRSRSSRSRASRPPGTASPSGRCAGAPRRPSSSSSSTRCSACATAGASCRAATIPPPTARWAAACRRACATSTRTSTASASTPRSACSPATATAARRCSPTSRARCARPRPSSASSAPPGCAAATRACARCSSGLGGVLRAIHAGSRLVLAAHPTDAARRDAFWIVGGRVVDWGALPEDPGRARRRAPPTRCAPRRGRSSAAGCARTRSPRRASSASGSPRTRRACTS